MTSSTLLAHFEDVSGSSDAGLAFFIGLASCT